MAINFPNQNLTIGQTHTENGKQWAWDGTSWNIQVNSANYTLPIASAGVLGGIKVGTNLAISPDGILSSVDTDTVYTLPVATSVTLGGVKVDGSSITINNGVISAQTGSTTFIGNTDTPNSFTSGKWLKVNAAGTALEWTDEPSGGGGGSGSGVPIGTIAIWSGNSTNIPGGWQLCDGTNGTPDLRDKFVVGANVSGDFTVGTSGGSRDAVVVNHSHTTSFDGGGAIPGVGGESFPYGGAGSYAYTTWNMDPAGVDGTDQNLPPYYSLCYIQCMNAGVNYNAGFTDLTDTPGSYSSAGGKWLKVNSGATGIEWVDAPQTGGTPGGSNTQLQWNNNGSFDGTSKVTWDSTNSDIVFEGTSVSNTLRWDSSQSVLKLESSSVKMQFVGDAQHVHTIEQSGDYLMVSAKGSGSKLYLDATSTIKFITAADAANVLLEAFDDGPVNLYHAYGKRFETTITGCNVLGTLSINGHLSTGYMLPGSDGSPNQAIVTNGNGTLSFADVLTLNSLSVTTATASGNGGLSYNNTNGVFTFTPPVITTYTDTNARNALSVTTGAASGGGTLSYNASTGVFSYAPADLSGLSTPDLSAYVKKTDNTHTIVSRTGGSSYFIINTESYFQCNPDAQCTFDVGGQFVVDAVGQIQLKSDQYFETQSTRVDFKNETNNSTYARINSTGLNLFTGGIVDKNGQTGDPGQVLSTTSGGLDWVTIQQSGGTVTDVIAGYGIRITQSGNDFTINGMETCHTASYDGGSGHNLHANTKAVMVMVVGGGGGAGSAYGNSSASSASGGGGGGCTAIEFYTREEAGNRINFSIGAGGASGTAQNQNGSNGGTSTATPTGTITQTITALGGSGSVSAGPNYWGHGGGGGLGNWSASHIMRGDDGGDARGYSWAGFPGEAGSINGIAMCGSNWGRGAKGAMSNNGSVVSTSHNSIGGWIGFWEF